ncbi:hypothetical protein WJX74_006967 [Apatococcus lobatus]|uniref:Pseudouridine-5'-phosphate glycosidase n=2 Tax=Apatococcus TaxID=904362 RepID=A0AAW1SPJ9_9CHLO
MDPSAWKRRISNLSTQLLGTPQSQQAVHVSEEVQQALQRGQAVVALESTIVTHGMPYPQNLETAREVEAVVRQSGAVPATVAVLQGEPCVGLTGSQLEDLASKGTSVRKTSRRDLPFVISRQMDGSTTVSATMLLAARAGIYVFVTGGIGGVHRGAETSMDISADLVDLGRTPMAVVCAGAKSILDIPRTLEFLETQGVCVAAYQSDDFPAFFTPSSGCRAPCRIEDPQQAAGLVASSLQLGLGSGILIGVPIPAEHAAEGSHIEEATQQALQEADAKNIQGHAITPFLLHRVQQLTGGASLAANIHLIKHNAVIGSQIACSLRSQLHPG